MKKKVENKLVVKIQQWQRDIYDAAKNCYRSLVLREIDVNGLNKSRFKVLVFSQFTSMLKLIEEELKRDSQLDSYLYLDGTVSSRKFKVFLTSLKAGGTGLNLTAAGYVFIVDPWWNPAVEAQAIDRSHRIGQDKVVFTYKYKLVSEGTVEEKVLELQEKKGKLFRSVVSAEKSLAKSLCK